MPNLIPKVNQLLELCFYRKCLSGNFNRKPIILMLFVKLLQVLLSRKKRDSFNPQSSRENKTLIIYENSFCGGGDCGRANAFSKLRRFPMVSDNYTTPNCRRGDPNWTNPGPTLDSAAQSWRVLVSFQYTPCWEPTLPVNNNNKKRCIF